jgi:RHS repeat-associated protein
MKSVCITLLLLLYFPILTIAQAPQPNWVLDKEITDGKTYIARDFIKMTDKFHFKADSGQSFVAKIDQCQIFPPIANTYEIKNGTSPVVYSGEMPAEGSGQQAMVVGNLSGSFNVSGSGAAVYTIPIEVPQGIKGIQPNLSLVYNSQSDMGLAGYRLDLAGISAISRVPHDYYLDGTFHAVSFDADDRFALDGRHMINVSTKSYGSDGCQYGFESEDFTSITSYGTNGNGPDNLVELKDGTTLTYGTQSDAQMFLTDKTLGIYKWFLKRVTDKNGNYCEYTYASNSDGETWLTEIKYTGNDNIGLTPACKIEFKYKSDALALFSFVGKNKLSQTKLLETINVFVDDKELRSFSLAYSGDKAISLTEKNNSNEFLKPVVFNWGVEDPNAGSNDDLAPVVPGTADDELIGDLDNDGIDELIRIEFGKTVSVYKMTSSYWTCVKCRLVPEASGKLEIVAVDDFIANGRKQLLLINLTPTSSESPTGEFLVLDKDLNTLIYDNNKFDRYKSSVVIGDFTGDVETDVLTVSSGVSKLFINGFDRIVEFIGDSNPFPYDDFSKVIAADCNADGKDDVLVNKAYDGPGGIREAVRIYTFENNEFICKKNDVIDGLNKTQVADFNNDGIADVFDPYTYSICYGIGFGISKTIKTSINKDVVGGRLSDDSETYQKLTIKKDVEFHGSSSSSFLCDVNNDGLMDIVKICNTVECVVKYKASDFFGDAGSLGYDYDKFAGEVWKEQVILNSSKYFRITGVATFPSAADPWCQLYLSYLSPHVYATVAINQGNGTFLNDYKTRHSVNLLDGKTKLMSGDFIGDGTTAVYAKTIENGSTKLTPLFRCVKGASVVDKITDGLGNELSITTNPLKIGNYYASDPAVTGSDISEMAGKLKVVTRATMPNGHVIDYTFKGAKLHKTRGFLGFSSRTEYNATIHRGVTTRMDLNNVYHFLYPQNSEIYTISYPTTLATQSFSYSYNAIGSSGKRFLPTLNSITEEKKQNKISTAKLVTEFKNYDAYGNPQSIKKSFGNGTEEEQTIGYVAKGSNCNNKTDYIVIKKTNAFGSISRRNEYSYDVKGNLVKIIADVGDKNETTTEYPAEFLNKWGNPTKIKVTANGTVRNSEIVYTATGRFVDKEIDTDLKKTIDYDYNEITGNLSNMVDESLNLTTAYEYDGFGRLTKTISPTKQQTASVFRWAGGESDKPTGAVYYQHNETTGVAPSRVWFDKLGREIRQDMVGLHDAKVYVTTEYNNAGFVWRVSEPYFKTNEASKNYAAVYTYDNPTGRVTSIVTPEGTTSFNYSTVNKVEVTSPKGVFEKTMNTLGQTISENVLGKSVDFTYWASGLVRSALPAGGTAIVTEYDLQGNRIKMTDPDAGVVTSEYNGFGQLVWDEQSNDVNNATQAGTTKLSKRNDYKYGLKGRLEDVVRTNVDGTKDTIHYSYDAKHRLLAMRLSGSHIQSYGYDSYGRVETVSEKIENNKPFERKVAFDAYGRLSKEFYPTGYYIVNGYDANGHLVSRTDSKGKAIWEAGTANAKGQWTLYKQGGRDVVCNYDSNGLPTYIHSNGVISMTYSYNSQGNLEKRIDNVKKQTEEFGYDPMHRLLSWTVTNNEGADVMNFLNYDGRNGNITMKSGIGDFMRYGENGQPPHALTSVAGNPDLVADALQDIGYTSFNKLNTITEGDFKHELTYGVDEQRRKGVFKTNGITTLTRYYLGNYEEEVRPGAPTRKIHYISGGNGLSAIYVQNGSADSLYYCYSDYQGNLLAVTNETGDKVLERLAYDPWGARRNPNNWKLPDTRPKHLVARGYTLHEHLDDFGLINMNGRAYDPLLARFLSPDPFIQAPGNWGNYNRYGYCMNNPLMFTDPSGYKWKWKYLNPVHWLSEGMQWINDNTEGLRAKMVDIGVPDMGVGINSAGGTYHYVGNSGNIYHNQLGNSDEAIQSRTTITFNEPIGQSGANFVANMGVSVENVRVNQDVVGDMVNYADYTEGFVGGLQLGMIEYRTAQPIMGRIGNFSTFSKIYSKLGTTRRWIGGASTYGGTLISIGLNADSWLNKESIGGGKFAYRTAGDLSSVAGGSLIGSMRGGPQGAIGGTIITALFWAGEQLYDGAIFGIDQISIYCSDFNRAISSGTWYPGR